MMSNEENEIEDVRVKFEKLLKREGMSDDYAHTVVDIAIRIVGEFTVSRKKMHNDDECLNMMIDSIFSASFVDYLWNQMNEENDKPTYIS